MYHWNQGDTSGKVVMKLGSFLGFEWNVYDPITFKVLQCGGYPRSNLKILYRGTVITCG